MFPSAVDGYAKSSARAKIGKGLSIPCTQVRIVAIPRGVRFWTAWQGSQVRVLHYQAMLGGSRRGLSGVRARSY